MLAAALLAACGDGSSPAGPDPVATVEIEPGSLELDLGEAATLAASARNAAGNVLPGRTVAWTSRPVRRGPFINVEPYGKATLSFGTEACGIRAVAGIDSKIGFTITVLDPEVGTFEKTFSPFTWPGLEWDCPLGNLDVATITNGEPPDEDGYRILVDAEDWGSVESTGGTLIEWVPARVPAPASSTATTSPSASPSAAVPMAEGPASGR